MLKRRKKNGRRGGQIQFDNEDKALRHRALLATEIDSYFLSVEFKHNVS